MPELTVATFNVHWGRGSKQEGWPPFDLVGACDSLGADVLVLQESWAPDGGVAQHDEIADSLGMRAVAVPMVRAVLSPKPKMCGRPGDDPSRGDGSWCLALLSRKPIRSSRVLPLPQIPWDPWARCLLHAEVDVDGTNLSVAATHFSHLEHGSVLQAPALRRGLPPTDRPGVFLGDLNMWGWTIDLLAPSGWRRAVRGKTWPAHRARHQIDHVLVTPAVEVVGGDVLPDQGSDHRPLRARLRVT